MCELRELAQKAERKQLEFRPLDVVRLIEVGASARLRHSIFLRVLQLSVVKLCKPICPSCGVPGFPTQMTRNRESTLPETR